MKLPTTSYSILIIHHQWRRSNQCHRAMALVDFLPRKFALCTILSTFKMCHFSPAIMPKILNQKASKPRKWHWLSLPPIGALDYNICPKNINTKHEKSYIVRSLTKIGSFFYTWGFFKV